jgi:hypothetical protein
VPLDTACGRAAPSADESEYHPARAHTTGNNADVAAIDRVNREAFGGFQESRLVTLLRESGTVIA